MKLFFFYQINIYVLNIPTLSFTLMVSVNRDFRQQIYAILFLFIDFSNMAA